MLSATGRMFAAARMRDSNDRYRDVVQMIDTEHSVRGFYELSDRQFDKLRKIIYESAGIHLNEGKKELVHARLSKVLRQRNIENFSEYLKILRGDSTGDELITLLDAISTNVTHFFRESNHFDFLAGILTDNGYQDGLRIWSAGCSSGEEPYSIAIMLREHILNIHSPKPHILATDLSTRILDVAINGTYPLKSIDNIDRTIVKKYFLRGTRNSEGKVKVKPDISSMVTFRRLNLVEPFEFSRRFDVIFCRNVMIYFDTETRQHIVDKFINSLHPGGYLIIGHSESLNMIKHSLQYVQPTIYRKQP